MSDVNAHPDPQRVLVFGGTGTIGRATVAALVARGHKVTCFGRAKPADARNDVTYRIGDVTNPASLQEDGICGDSFDAVVSCLASRTGVAMDAWQIDYKAHLTALGVVQAAGIRQFVLLSAICVQKPRLPFQQAKRAFELALMDSGLIYSIVRPTAFFKSLSGQVGRVKKGKPYLVFGDGTETACKPISDGDLARYMAQCLEDTRLQNKVLPIGGPGPAISPRDQAMYLFERIGVAPKFRSVSPKLLSAIAAMLDVPGVVSRRMAAKAELARIGRYYATESMLVYDAERERYDAAATPEYGTETLFSFYNKILDGDVQVDRGEHAVF